MTMLITNAQTIIEINNCLLPRHDAYIYYDKYDHVKCEITNKNKKVVFDDFNEMKQYIIDNNLFKTN